MKFDEISFIPILDDLKKLVSFGAVEECGDCGKGCGGGGACGECNVEGCGGG